MKTLRLALPLLAALLIAGCGEESKPPTSAVTEPPVQTIPLELESAMTAKLDELSGAGSLDGHNPPSIFDTNFDYYAVVFVWGTLHPTSILGGPIIDWSGSMNFNGVGDINPVHPIDFEPETDAIIPERTTGYAEWRSSTLVEFDGIAGVVSHDRRVVYILPPRLQFATAPFSIELRLDQLERFFGIFPVDNMNAVAVMAHRIHRNVCARGGFKGAWVRDDISGFSGSMHGLWFNAHGDSVGRYAGKYWVAENGDYLFEGAISGLVTDEIRAHFRGTWWFDDHRMCPAPECGTSHGQFRGKLAYLNSGNIGDISGEFGDYTGNMVMPMHGDWRVFCRDSNSPRAEQMME